MPAIQALTFEGRLGLLVERGIVWRDNRRLERLLRQAKLKQAQACRRTSTIAAVEDWTSGSWSRWPDAIGYDIRKTCC